MLLLAAFYSLMISNENALEMLMLRASARTSRGRHGLAYLAAVAVTVHRAASTVRTRFRKTPADFGPDRFATETAFLSDSWPRS